MLGLAERVKGGGRTIPYAAVWTVVEIGDGTKGGAGIGKENASTADMDDTVLSPLTSLELILRSEPSL